MLVAFLTQFISRPNIMQMLNPWTDRPVCDALLSLFVFVCLFVCLFACFLFWMSESNAARSCSVSHEWFSILIVGACMMRSVAASSCVELHEPLSTKLYCTPFVDVYHSSIFTPCFHPWMTALIRACIWPVSSRVFPPIGINSIDGVVDPSIAFYFSFSSCLTSTYNLLCQDDVTSCPLIPRCQDDVSSCPLDILMPRWRFILPLDSVVNRPSRPSKAFGRTDCNFGDFWTDWLRRRDMTTSRRLWKGKTRKNIKIYLQMRLCKLIYFMAGMSSSYLTTRSIF